MSQIVGGKLHLVPGILAGGGLPVVHQGRSVPLGTDKGVFHPLSYNGGLVQHFNVLTLFTGLDLSHGRSPACLFVQRCFSSAGAT